MEPHVGTQTDSRSNGSNGRQTLEQHVEKEEDEEGEEEEAGWGGKHKSLGTQIHCIAQQQTDSSATHELPRTSRRV